MSARPWIHQKDLTDDCPAIIAKSGVMFNAPQKAGGPNAPPARCEECKRLTPRARNISACPDFVAYFAGE
jgi:hypothetical protein